MSIGHVNPALAGRLPLERIAEICQRYGVSELSVYGLGPEGDAKRAEEPLFLVMFDNNDFGPGDANSTSLKTISPVLCTRRSMSHPVGGSSKALPLSVAITF
jgi:hypothetical protein